MLNNVDKKKNIIPILIIKNLLCNTELTYQFCLALSVIICLILISKNSSEYSVSVSLENISSQKIKPIFPLGKRGNIAKIRIIDERI
jgi:hypothetical protein